MSFTNAYSNLTHSKAFYRKATLAFLFWLGLTMALIDVVSVLIAGAEDNEIACLIDKKCCSEVIVTSLFKQIVFPVK